ncbi:MAG: ABC transporter permease [Candidatus Aminicenantes bacterium]|nr:MAG: ABC transporter permease [Candidatus Aminicenantes bacterium]
MHEPPRLTERLLKRIFPDNGTFTTIGDLEEVYHSIAEEKGPAKARLWYRLQAFKSVFSYYKNQFFWSLVMFKNYLVFTSRLIKRDKFHYFLNFLGLSTGIACCIIIMLFLRNELTYDQHHEKADRIHRISSNYVTSGKPLLYAITSPALGPRLKEEYPEIDDFVRLVPLPEVLFIHGDKRLYQERIVLADPSILKVFTHPLLQGNMETCLKEPNSIVLTATLARRYFGEENPMGKIIQVENQGDFMITGVIKDPPRNSHIPIEGIISFSTWDTDQQSLNWSMYEVFGYTYVLLPEKYDIAAFYEKFPVFYEKYFKADEESYGQVYKPIFLKLKDIHYNTFGFRAEMPLGSRSYLYAFFFIGIFILILACVNYVNMATARSSTRVREIGMKKVLGSGKGDLGFQLLGESLLVSFIAMIIAYGAVLLSLTPLNQRLGLNLETGMLFNPIVIAVVLGLFLLIGILSGIYPAFYLSAIRSVTAISGGFSSGRTEGRIRRILVAFQFVISIGVVIITLFMSRQIEFMRSRDLGFKKESVVSIRLRDNDVVQKVPAFKQELIQHPDVISVATGIGQPGNPNTGLYKFEGGDGMVDHNFWVLWAGFDFIQTLGAKIVEGRDFDPSFSTDRQKGIIVNETLVRFMEWENPIGKRITQGTHTDGLVIGVVKDFHFASLHNKIEPMLIRMIRSPDDNMPGSTPDRLMVRLKGQSLTNTMAWLEDRWNKFNPNRPFVFSFLDESFDRLYDADRRQNRLVKIFSYICIIISLLGLLGLSSFTSLRRTKEVALRKVLGASATQIVLIMFREIFFLIVVAIVVAIPISLLFIDVWLEKFAYKTGINPLLLAATAIGALVVAFLTASYHSIKVAYTNPVDNLRYE